MSTIAKLSAPVKIKGRRVSEITPPRGILKPQTDAPLSNSLDSQQTNELVFAPPKAVVVTPQPQPEGTRSRKTSRVHFKDENLALEIPERYRANSPDPYDVDYPSGCSPAFRISAAMSNEAKFLILKSYEDELRAKLSECFGVKKDDSVDEDSGEMIFEVEQPTKSVDPFVAYGRLKTLVLDTTKAFGQRLTGTGGDTFHWFHSVRMAVEDVNLDDL